MDHSEGGSSRSTTPVNPTGTYLDYGLESHSRSLSYSISPSLKYRFARGWQLTFLGVYGNDKTRYGSNVYLRGASISPTAGCYCNDWSLRTLAPVEMKTGFGWVQAKLACSVAPFAVTPEALGDAWRACRVHLPLTVRVNDHVIGAPDGGEMQFGFDALIAHAARTRDLPAGTIIGSGTVSNADHRRVGSTCLSEVRAIETIAHGAPRSRFLAFGDRVAMHAAAAPGPFGTIDQVLVRGAGI